MGTNGDVLFALIVVESVESAVLDTFGSPAEAAAEGRFAASSILLPDSSCGRRMLSSS